MQGNTKRGRLAQLLRWCDQRHGLKDQGGKSDCWVRLLPILTTKSLQAKDLRLNRVFRCARFGCESDGLTSGDGFLVKYNINRRPQLAEKLREFSIWGSVVSSYLFVAIISTFNPLGFVYNVREASWGKTGIKILQLVFEFIIEI